MPSRFSWFGIDFGTTNSAAFSFTGVDENTIIPIHYGDDEGRPFPSVVAINKNTGEVICGRDAKDQRHALQETHVYFSSIKSIIDSNQTWMIAGKEWTPEDIAAEILKALKARVERDNDNIMDEVVMAVPVGYSAGKKMHLRNAAKKAGINIKMFISEPTAAFCSNYHELCACKNVAVFDWGGGTLDVVVLKIENGNISELSAEGMAFAGNDIDQKFAAKMHAKFMRNKTPVIPMEELPATAQDQLLSKCEKAKCDFDDEDVVSLSINRYGSYGAVRDSVEYDYFSLLIEQDIDNAVNCLKSAIQKAGLNTGSLDRILCVGGSSKLRPLREKLKSIFGEDMLLYPDKVMWDIAKGAALISTKQGGYTLSKSIGLQLCDGTYFPLFKKGQPVPCEELKMTFSVIDQGSSGLQDARFIFTDSASPEERELYEPFVLPLRGFADEYIQLCCYIDQDNVFKLKVGSNRVSETRAKVWHYENLKVSFHIEDDRQ